MSGTVWPDALNHLLHDVDWNAVAAWVALLLAGYTSFRDRTNRNVDRAREARNELLDAMVKLGEVRAELIALSSKPPGSIYDDRVLTGHHRDTREVLALRARELLKDIPEQQSSTTYLALALAFEESNELGYAEEMVRLAVSSARTPLDRGGANRTLSRFEFRNGNIPAGRRAMNRSLDAYSANDPLTVFERVGSMLELAEFEVIFAEDRDLAVSAWRRSGAVTQQWFPVGSPNHTKLAEQAQYVLGLILRKFPGAVKPLGSHELPLVPFLDFGGGERG